MAHDQTLAPPLTTDAEMVLELDGISKSFAGVAALSDVTLHVMRGEVHALLGENGAGKSTLMNVATGSLQPDSGAIRFGEEELQHLTPADASARGIVIVHQHPAVMPDLTVLENLRVALPADAFRHERGIKAAAAAMLERVGLDVPLDIRVEELTVAQKHLLEISKALAVQPTVLVLDEPTAALGSESVDLLFTLVRRAVADGVAVVYITHRMAEVRSLADRVTVLRDGKVARADVPIEDITDAELLDLIVGRRLVSAFPPKHEVDPAAEANLVVRGLSGPGFHDVSFSAYPGEIIGIAGVVGNGQPQLLKALGGRLPRTAGTVELGGAEASERRLHQRAGYMPADRHVDGLMMDFGVRENAAIAALKKFGNGFFVSRRREVAAVGEALGALSVKAPSLETPVASLSGGNQQKIVMARTRLSEPAIVLADEPTQGVDVGARFEIYDILRNVSRGGVPVIVNSSDAAELEGLCDRVLVMSRGQVIEELVGDDITEDRMVKTAVSATTSTISLPGAHAAGEPARRGQGRLARMLSGDYSPAILLGVVVLLLGGFILTQNARYLNDFNLSSMMLLISALGFMALGQTIIVMTGGIDLSVGPLAGFLVVISSFFVNPGAPGGALLLGLATMLGAAIVVGLLNGALIRFARFTAVAATLVLYIGLQGMSFILRPTTGGTIDPGVIAAIKTTIGPVPLAMLALVVVAVLLELALRRTRWGWQLRAAGSDESNARRVGVPVNRTIVLGYVAGAALTFLGSILLMAQLGVGDPSQGIGYTMTSITAVVLGGTSLLGGRGSFIGSLMGSVLLIQVMNATIFLKLDQMWQFLLQGLLIIGAAVVYTLARRRRQER